LGNAALKNSVLRQTDRVEKTLTLQELVDVRRGEGGVLSDVATQVPFPVTLNDRFQNGAPAAGAMNIDGAKGTPLKVTELVEQE
jgi:hypothetical protein